MNNNPRYLSIQILIQCQQDKEPVDTVMDRILRQTDLTDPRDSHLVMALVYGVLRRRRYLDAVISHFSRHPLKKMKDITLQALRTGAFQLLFMDRIPASAAVNETVKALKIARQPKWLVNFVNGVLRALARRGYDPDSWEESNWSPPVLLSHPDWLYARYRGRYGEERAKEICTNNNRQPCLTLCLNHAAVQREEFMNLLSRQKIQALPGRYNEAAVILPEYSGLIRDLPGYDQGWFMIQDEGAQLITRMLTPFRAGSYLDACAGVGGKTVQLQQLLPANGRLTALEPNKRRFHLLRENLERMNLTSTVTVSNTDLQHCSRQSTAQYDSILIDAPCSGLGVVRRHPDIRWNLEHGPKDLKRYQKKQATLLDEAASLLSDGGILVYATCSTEPEENDLIIEQFLTSHPQFRIEPPEFPQDCRALLDEQGLLRLIPGEYNDGFYAARLIKR